MKILACLLSLCLVHVAFAEEPEELVKLRMTWENSVAGVQARADTLYREEMNKTNKLYHEELKQMKDNFMEAKNLDGANAVDAEIKKLIAEHGKQKFAPAKKVQAQQKPISPLDGVWVCKGKATSVVVFKGGKMIYADGNMGNVTLKNGIIHVQWDSGWWHKLTPDPKITNLWRGTNPHKAQFTYERLKW